MNLQYLLYGHDYGIGYENYCRQLIEGVVQINDPH
jgi:hypothetical protein